MVKNYQFIIHQPFKHLFSNISCMLLLNDFDIGFLIHMHMRTL